VKWDQKAKAIYITFDVEMQPEQTQSETVLEQASNPYAFPYEFMSSIGLTANKRSALLYDLERSYNKAHQGWSRL